MGDGVDIEHIEPETPHSAAIYEAGRALLIETVEVGREFCRFMVGIATGAIPAYLALVGLALGKNYKPNLVEGVLLLVAPSLLLVSASIFAFGCFPVQTLVSLDLPEEIELARAAATKRRYTCALAGFSVFAVAVVLAVAEISYAVALSR